MKQFYGEISVVAKLSYCIEAENEEEAKRKLFEAKCPIELVDDNDEPVCEITEQQWHLVDEQQQGNRTEPDLNDFWIQEEN